MAQATNRQDEANVSLTVDGRPCPFHFQKRSGGKVTSEGSKTPPGSMLPKRAHGGIPDIEDLTLEAEFIPARDDAYVQWLKSRVGKGRFGAVENLLDVDGNVVRPGVNRWSGVLSGFATGDYDSTSSDPRMLVLDFECDGNPA